MSDDERLGKSARYRELARQVRTDAPHLKETGNESFVDDYVQTRIVCENCEAEIAKAKFKLSTVAKEASALLKRVRLVRQWRSKVARLERKLKLPIKSRMPVPSVPD